MHSKLKLILGFVLALVSLLSAVLLTAMHILDVGTLKVVLLACALDTPNKLMGMWPGKNGNDG
jgi:hypothetical protein